VDSLEFRRVVGHFATGVVVVTSADPMTDTMHGVTVNSFTSVSLDPTLILVCIDASAQSHDFLTQRETFAVNVLARRQIALAERFAGRAPLVSAEFRGVPHDLGVNGMPLLHGCVAWLECRREAVYPGGDHSILVGEVLDARTGEDDDPLMFFTGDYTSLTWG
jgi:flavin reductase (DIM6/NTAB) family NADH-FMN oxidoreductase RutF